MTKQSDVKPVDVHHRSRDILYVGHASLSICTVVVCSLSRFPQKELPADPTVLYKHAS